MRDNGDDAFGEPLARVDRHAPSRLSPSPPSSLLPTSLPSTISSTTSTTSVPLISSSPLETFIRSVHVALDSGLSVETLVANIHLISQERAEGQVSHPSSHDEFFSMRFSLLAIALRFLKPLILFS